MNNLNKFRKSTVAILTALLIIAIAAPLVSFAAAAGAPTASLGTTSGPNGTLIKVSGTNFGASEAVGAITVTVDGLAGKAITTTSATPSATIASAYQLKTDSNGVLTGYFIIYGLSPGSHTVIISDASTSIIAGTFTITKPTVTISPSAVVAGTSVTVSASGYPTTNSTFEPTFANQIISANFSGNAITVAGSPSSSTNNPYTLSSNKIATSILTGNYLGTVSATVSLPAINTALGAVFNMTDSWNNVGTATLSLTTPTVTLSPNSGPVGTVVTATLSGFGPTATIASVTVGNSASTSPATYTGATVTEQGTAAIVFTTPAGTTTTLAGVAGVQTVTVVDSLGNVATATFTVTPQVTLALGASSVSSGTTFAPASTANGQMFVSITGFKAKAELSFQTSPNIPVAWKNATATWGVSTGSYSATTGKLSTDANGAAVFTTDMATTPTQAGQYSITISDGTNSVSTIVTITTTGNIIAVSPSSGAKGSTVTVSYFGTSTPAAIYFDGSSVATPSTGASAWPAAATATFTVPQAAASGLHTVSAGVTFNSVGFTVNAPALTLVSPASASVGTTVTLVGTGFGVNASLILMQGASVAPATYTLVGDTLIATFAVPNYIPGSYSLSLSDGVTTATGTLSVSSASIAVSPTSGTLGSLTKIGFTGSGFKAGESITVTFDNTPITASSPVGLTVINTNGGMLINSGFSIPSAATAGAHTIMVQGASGAYATATFNVQPKLNSLPAVRPGAQIAITGNGFSANSAQTLTVNGTATTWLNVGTTPASALSAGTSVVTTSSGGLYATVPVGFVVSSTETSTALHITVTDTLGYSASTDLTILATPAIVLGSSSVIAGTPSGMGVTINGTGFTPSTLRTPTGAAPISANLYSGSTLVAAVTLSTATVTIADTGSFGTSAGVTFVIPATVSPGAYTLQFQVGTAGSNTPVETASTTVTVLGSPSVVAPATVASGSNVTLTVTGLTQITGATFNSVAIASFGPTTVSSSGANAYTLTTWFIVPTSAFAGSYLLTLSDSNTNLVCQTAIAVTPSIAISPTTGSKGTTIYVNASGFAATSAITAKVNGAAVTLNTTATNSTGGFAAQFTIPITATATNTLTITDASGNAASATFTLTAPTLTVSPTSAQTGNTVQIMGSGYTVGSAIVVQINNVIVATTPTNLVATTGSFIGYITVPTGLSGNVTVTATDSSNNVGTAILSVGGTTTNSVPNQTTMTTTAQTTTSTGTATTTFTAGTSTVNAGFVLQTNGSPRDVVVAVTWQGPGGRVYNMASFQTTMDSNARTVSFSNLIPAGVTGTWTVQLQVFASDGVTALGVTTLTFTAQ